MTVKVGINGFGRIGRLVMRIGANDPNIEFVGVNDLVESGNDTSFVNSSVFMETVVVTLLPTVSPTTRMPSQMPSSAPSTPMPSRMQRLFITLGRVIRTN